MPLNASQVQYDLIQLKGGLDQVTPTLSLAPGVVRRAVNFEASITGGYTRIAGYERFDGRAYPADAVYTILNGVFPGVFSGDNIVGVTSAAASHVLVVMPTYVVVTRETGTYIEGETLKVGVVNVGTLVTVTGGVADAFLDATYTNLAANEYRTSIQVVPGSGPILGVVFYKSNTYAWRNNSAGTAAAIYKSSTSGWTLIDLGKQISFTLGTGEIFEGDTITGATSGATGVVSRVVLETGTWASTDAAGRLMLSSTTGTFSAGEFLKVGGVNKATGSGAASAVTLLPNGRIESVIGNFGGGTAGTRVYGADGVNKAFEFDGTVYVPISSGMAIDAPKHVLVHKQHLFLSFGPSLQFSALGYPYQFVPLLGAGELALSEEVTNLVQLPGDQTSGALGIYTRNETAILYGTDATTFKLSTFNTGTGGIHYTVQNMDQAYVLDDRGIMSLSTSLNFGNFAPASLSMNIRPFVQIRRNLASASMVNREKGQYRLFFSDGFALYMTMLNGQLLGSMPIEFPNPVTCCVEGEASDGTATSFFGSTDGFVYRLDAGTSFDGQPIVADFTLVYNTINSPRLLKRFRKASVEMTGSSYAEILFGYDLGYRSLAYTQPGDVEYTNDLRPGYWDAAQWDTLVWDGSDISPSEIEVEGTAENMAVRISTSSAILQPFTVNSVIVHYTTRRGLR